MAFQSNAAAPSANAGSSTNPSWDKAAGFINLYLPSKDGKQRKLGAIPLKMSKANEKQLLEWLESDDANVASLASKLIVTYQSAQPNAAHAFDLG